MQKIASYCVLRVSSFIIIFFFLIPNISFSQSIDKADSTKTHRQKDTINYLYKTINAPTHTKFPTPVLQDSDSDGIPDQLDLEPNTPKGAEVDTHGRALDTDGDGVPDYKDKEKLTQQICFPVDSNGVGVCPEPVCCREFSWPHHPLLLSPDERCNLNGLPTIIFKKGESMLSKKVKTILDSVAKVVLVNPHCYIKVVGYQADLTSYHSSQQCWDHVYLVVRYLIITKGILSSHIIFSYENQGDSNTVDLQPTTDSGPSNVPAPHPFYSTVKYHEIDW